MMCENCFKEHDGSYGSGRFCSKFCKNSFNSKKKDNKHRKPKRENIIWKCDKCNEILKTRKLLDEHKKLHRKEYNWICKICNTKFESKHKLYEHKKLMNHQEKITDAISDNPYCQYCGEYHLNKHGLTIHERLCLKNPNRDVQQSEKLSKIQKEIHKNNPQLRINASKRTINNSFWKYRSQNPIFIFVKTEIL